MHYPLPVPFLERISMRITQDVTTKRETKMKNSPWEMSNKTVYSSPTMTQIAFTEEK